MSISYLNKYLAVILMSDSQVFSGEQTSSFVIDSNEGLRKGQHDVIVTHESTQFVRNTLGTASSHKPLLTQSHDKNPLLQ